MTVAMTFGQARMEGMLHDQGNLGLTVAVLGCSNDGTKFGEILDVPHSWYTPESHLHVAEDGFFP